MTSSQAGEGAVTGSAGVAPGPAPGSSAAARAGAAGPGDGTVIRSEERLLVGTELVESGRVRVTKFIVTQDVTLTVQLRREEVRLEWLPADGPNAGGAAPGGAVRPEDFEIVLHAEQPAVTKQVVPVERIRLATRIVTSDATVNEVLRKEQISDPEVEVNGEAGHWHPSPYPGSNL